MSIFSTLRGALLPQSSDTETDADTGQIDALKFIAHDDQLHDAAGHALRGRASQAVRLARLLRSAARNNPEALAAAHERKGKELAASLKAAGAALATAEGNARKHDAEQGPRLAAVEAKLQTARTLAETLAQEADRLERDSAARFAQAVLNGTEGELKRADERAAAAKARTDADAERRDADALAQALETLRASFSKRQAELQAATEQARTIVQRLEREGHELAWDRGVSELLAAGWRAGAGMNTADLSGLVLPVFDASRVFGGDFAGPRGRIGDDVFTRLEDVATAGTWVQWRADVAGLLADVEAYRADLERKRAERSPATA